MNPEQLLAYIMGQTGNAFKGAWNSANQAALPMLRSAANLVARPLGYGIGASMGLNNNQMNDQYYGDVSRGLISDQSPLMDASSFVLPDAQGAMKGDPYAIAGFVPYAGRISRPVGTVAKGIKEGQQITKMIKPALKSAKPAAKGVKPAKTAIGRGAQHVDRNAGKYFGGTIAADLVNSMYGR
jgi:hypothetical protein